MLVLFIVFKLLATIQESNQLQLNSSNCSNNTANNNGLTIGNKYSLANIVSASSQLTCPLNLSQMQFEYNRTIEYNVTINASEWFTANCSITKQRLNKTTNISETFKFIVSNLKLCDYLTEDNTNHKLSIYDAILNQTNQEITQQVAENVELVAKNYTAAIYTTKSFSYLGIIFLVSFVSIILILDSFRLYKFLKRLKYKRRNKLEILENSAKIDTEKEIKKEKFYKIKAMGGLIKTNIKIKRANLVSVDKRSSI